MAKLPPLITVAYQSYFISPLCHTLCKKTDTNQTILKLFLLYLADTITGLLKHGDLKVFQIYTSANIKKNYTDTPDVLQMIFNLQFL
jgi:hypothetical protein